MNQNTSRVSSPAADVNPKGAGQATESTWHVLYLSPVPNFKGGAERSLMHLLQNPGVTASVAAPAHGPVLEAAAALGLPTLTLDTGTIDQIKRPFRFRDGLRAAKDLMHASRSLAQYSKQYKIQVVHSNGLKAHFINCIARRAFNGAPAVVHLRDIALTRSERWVWYILQRLADHLILVSKPCWPGTDLPLNATVIHNGITTEVELLAPAASLNRDELRVAVVGRLHPEKGQHLAVEWVSALRAAGVSARLSIRGEFTDDAPTYETQLKLLIAQLGMEPFVEMTGFIADPAAVYADVDLVLVPSVVPDPLPRAVMEGMQRQLPIVAYPSGGIPEMIEDGVTGYLATDSAGFVSAVQALLDDPERTAELLAAARDKLTREFSSEALFAGVNQVYSLSIKPATKEGNLGSSLS